MIKTTRSIEEFLCNREKGKCHLLVSHKRTQEWSPGRIRVSKSVCDSCLLGVLVTFRGRATVTLEKRHMGKIVLSFSPIEEGEYKGFDFSRCPMKLDDLTDVDIVIRGKYDCLCLETIFI